MLTVTRCSGAGLVERLRDEHIFGRVVQHIAAFVDEAVTNKFLDELRDERRTHIEGPGEVGARRGTVCPETREDR